ncbi:hypothetical protein ACWA5Z_06500 [Testudinibacter sp. P80/BLE/0925]
MLRPSLSDEALKEAFLAEWVAENYADEIQEEKKEYHDGEDIDVKHISYYENINESWCYWKDNDDTAERLIKYHNWTFTTATEFAEKDLYWAARKHTDKLSKQWIEENGYTLPFSVGARVKYREYEGVIVEDKKNEHLPLGKVAVLTDDQAEKNRQNEERGVIMRHGGYICKWEELTLIDEAGNDMD